MILRINSSKTNLVSKTSRIFLVTLFTCLGLSSFAQKNTNVVDEVVAVIGDEIVLLSDIKNKLKQAIDQGLPNNEETNCVVIEETMYETMLLNQAKLDSVEITDAQIEGELDRRMRFYIGQLGGTQQFEQFYGKSLEEFKEEFREPIKNQMMVQQVQASITADINITPSEVGDYYRNIPSDSLPYINSQIEVAHIVREPRVSEEEKQRVIKRLNEFRDKIISEERDFETTAILYSQDPGSAPNGGDLGIQGRGTFVPEFEAVAYRLSVGEISKVFESPFGYHIIQLVDRIGEKIETRHILLKTEASPADLTKSESFLRDLSKKIASDSITFGRAALNYSDDKDSKNNGGNMVNPGTGTSKFETDQIDPQLFYTVDKMEVGQISIPTIMQTQSGGKAYRLVKLVSRTKPHIANLKDDYTLIKDVALSDKKSKAVDAWMNRVLSRTYVKLSDGYRACDYSYQWNKNHQ